MIMNILLSNDDGVFAEGINALYNTLSEKHNVFIIAPDEEKSGCSTGMTFKDNLKIINIAKNIYAINGFTADCVNIGLKGDIIPKADLVISGINHGPNLGDDIYFSGTVGGARVAYIYGISGIAISLNCKGKSEFFKNAARFLLGFIENPELFPGNKSLFLNINYPDLPDNEILGVKFSSLGRRKYNDSYKVTGKENGKISLQYIRETGLSGSDSSDIAELKKGYITVTPLTLDCTDYDVLNNLVQLPLASFAE